MRRGGWRKSDTNRVCVWIELTVTVNRIHRGKTGKTKILEPSLVLLGHLATQHNQTVALTNLSDTDSTHMDDYKLNKGLLHYVVQI